MQKYFINKIKNNIISFQKSDEHHLLDVMRIKINDEVCAINNNKRYLVKIISLDPLRAEIINEIVIDNKNSFDTNVYFASIKNKYIEIAIAKACELNVDNFYIFYSNYSQGNIMHNLERYNKIIKESCEQCNRDNLMNIQIINNQELINSLNANDLNLIADFSNEKLELNNLLKPNSNIGIIIGPEGGFNEYDYKNIFDKVHYHKIHLTKTILRAETAMIYLVSIVSYELLKMK